MVFVLQGTCASWFWVSRADYPGCLIKKHWRHACEGAYMHVKELTCMWESIYACERAYMHVREHICMWGSLQTRCEVTLMGVVCRLWCALWLCQAPRPLPTLTSRVIIPTLRYMCVRARTCTHDTYTQECVHLMNNHKQTRMHIIYIYTHTHVFSQYSPHKRQYDGIPSCCIHVLPEISSWMCAHCTQSYCAVLHVILYIYIYIYVCMYV